MNSFWHYFHRLVIFLLIMVFGIFHFSDLVVKGDATDDFYAYLPIIVKPPCTSYSATTEMTLPSTIQANNTITITTNLKNTGCSYLGRPIYQINLQTPQQPLPLTIATVVHSLSVESGNSDSAEIPITMTNTGQVTLTAVTSFEIHYDTGPPIWGRSESQPITIMVTP